jgi:hypothetical protein
VASTLTTRPPRATIKNERETGWKKGDRKEKEKEGIKKKGREIQKDST